MESLSVEDGLEGDYWLLPRVDQIGKAIDTRHEPSKTIRNRDLLSPLNHLIQSVLAHPMSLHKEASLIATEYDPTYL